MSDVEAVLAAHVAVLTAGRIKDWTVPVSCECGWVARGETWAAHVAAALQPLIDAEKQRAWDEGASASSGLSRATSNPYRRAAAEETTP